MRKGIVVAGTIAVDRGWVADADADADADAGGGVGVGRGGGVGSGDGDGGWIMTRVNDNTACTLYPSCVSRFSLESVRHSPCCPLRYPTILPMGLQSCSLSLSRERERERNPQCQFLSDDPQPRLLATSDWSPRVLDTQISEFQRQEQEESRRAKTSSRNTAGCLSKPQNYENYGHDAEDAGQQQAGRAEGVSRLSLLFALCTITLLETV